MVLFSFVHEKEKKKRVCAKRKRETLDFPPQTWPEELRAPQYAKPPLLLLCDPTGGLMQHLIGLLPAWLYIDIIYIYIYIKKKRKKKTTNT